MRPLRRSLASFRTGVIAPNMFMPLAGYYLSMVDFHVYPMHIAEHTNALNCHPILQAFYTTRADKRGWR
jgi:hypothetical protein